LTNEQQGPVTALKHSDVGFVAVGYDTGGGGGVTLIDLRGPAIIHTVSLKDVFTKKRRGSIRRNDHHADRTEWPTVLEFGVMTLEGDGEIKSGFEVPTLTLHRLFLNCLVCWYQSWPCGHVQNTSVTIWPVLCTVFRCRLAFR